MFLVKNVRLCVYNIYFDLFWIEWLKSKAWRGAAAAPAV